MNFGIKKTDIGLSVFDEAFGGIYQNRATLIQGPRNSGKSILATHFIGEKIKAGEHVVLFSDRRIENIILDANGMSLDFAAAIKANLLHFISVRAQNTIQSPFEPFTPGLFEKAMEKLTRVVKSYSIRYAVFNSVVPWVATLPVSNMPVHVEEFINAINNSLSLTSLLVMPRALSEEAHTLAEHLVELCPIVIELQARLKSEHVMTVSKYHGSTMESAPKDFLLELHPGVGFIPLGSEQPPPQPQRKIVSAEKGGGIAAKKIVSKVQKPLPPPKPRHTYTPFVPAEFIDFSLPDVNQSAVQKKVPADPKTSNASTFASIPSVPFANPTPQPLPPNIPAAPSPGVGMHNSSKSSLSNLPNATPSTPPLKPAVKLAHSLNGKNDAPVSLATAMKNAKTLSIEPEPSLGGKISLRDVIHTSK